MNMNWNRRNWNELMPERIADLMPHKTRGESHGMNVGTPERVLSGIVGFWLLRSAAKRGGWAGAAMLLPAAAVLKRAFTGKCELYQASGLSSASDSHESSRGERKSLGRSETSFRSGENGDASRQENLLH